ncbi:MAG TPA: septum formation initiator family protein [Alphaproteobacteria bacterium]|nr:septum formation initiator family protein [Alphaproteobacteria bacterium]
MAQEKELNSYFKKAIGPLIGGCLIFYFVYHLLNGDRGVFSWRRLELKVKEAERVRDDLNAQKQLLDTKVNLLRPDSLDPDLLEQRAKEVLGFKHESEVTLDASDFIVKN